MLQELQPIHIGKADVRDHQVKGLLFEELQGFLGVFCQMEGIAVLRKAFQKHLPQFRLVFDDQYGSSVHEEI
jgi:hypothetical protein